VQAGQGKAALKTRALQTLARPLLAIPVSQSFWSASDLSALSAGHGFANGSKLSRGFRPIHIGAVIASPHGRTPPPFAMTCSKEFNSNCTGPVS